MTETPVVSEFQQAGLIVHIRVVAEDLSSWEAEEAGYQRRGGTLAVQVVDVLKGRLDVASGATVDVQISERGSAGGLVLDFYGIWAHVPTAPGTELVAFCDGTGADLADQLTDEHCEQLVEAATVLDDLRLALALDTQRLTADQLIEEASRLRARGGALFARYVWVNVRDAVVESADRFAALMRIAEDPQTTTAAQEAYLMAAYEDATFTESWPTELRVRLARAMFRAALDPATPELREPVLGTLIPNLVDAAVPETLSALEVFGSHADLAEQVGSAPEAAHLHAWLEGDE